MADAFIFNIVFIVALGYQVMESAKNQISPPEIQDLQCSMSVQAKEIESTEMNALNINQLCAIGGNNNFQ